MRFIFVSCLVLWSMNAISKTYYDLPQNNLFSLFCEARAKYVIRHHHTFADTLFIPPDCEIIFDGGSLSGPIIMNNTTLSGKVNLKGSSLGGRVRNKRFEASWLCYMDGVSDDARNINQMIEVCGKIFFAKGKYRLKSEYCPVGKVRPKFYKSIKAHIGICNSNIILEGEKGTCFETTDTIGTICIFSPPKKISKSVCNIAIKNITFKVHNDSKHFREFMHTIKTIGVNGLMIEKCSFDDFWGDAICLSHYGDNPRTGQRTLNQNVKILNNHIEGGYHHNNRNGISVISGRNILIKNNIIKNTSRKNMPGGIDVEPNNSAFTMDNIRIEKNYLEGIKGGGAISMFIHKKAPAHNIDILSNHIRRCYRGLRIIIRTENTTDSIMIKDNHVEADTKPYLFRGKGKSKNWIVAGNLFEKASLQIIPGNIIVENLIIK